LLAKKKVYKITDCPKEETTKQVYQNRIVQFYKPEGLVFAEKFRTTGQCNKGFKVGIERYKSKSGSTKRKSKYKASRIRHRTCYTCRYKSHLSKDCTKTQTLIYKVVNNNISNVNLKNDTSTIKMISSPCDSPRAIWVLKFLLTNHEGPNKAWVPKLA
jgi:hypothetical protein